MTSLFIANTSSKHHEFLFRLPGIEQVRRIFINAGTQQEVLKNAQPEEVNFVISQHLMYGLVEASQAHKIDKFSGTIYSIDKPVPANLMSQTIEKNNDVLLQEGYELRKVAAVATDASLEKHLEENRVAGRQNATEMEVEEIPDESNAKKKLIKQKIRVTKD